MKSCLNVFNHYSLIFLKLCSHWIPCHLIDIRKVCNSPRSQRRLSYQPWMMYTITMARQSLVWNILHFLQLKVQNSHVCMEIDDDDIPGCKSVYFTSHLYWELWWATVFNMDHKKNTYLITTYASLSPILRNTLYVKTFMLRFWYQFEISSHV